MKNDADYYIDMFNEELDIIKDIVPADRFYEMVPSTLIDGSPPRGRDHVEGFMDDINQAYKQTAMKRCLQGLGIDDNGI